MFKTPQSIWKTNFWNFYILIRCAHDFDPRKLKPSLSTASSYSYNISQITSVSFQLFEKYRTNMKFLMDRQTNIQSCFTLYAEITSSEWKELENCGACEHRGQLKYWQFYLLIALYKQCWHIIENYNGEQIRLYWIRFILNV